MASKKIGPVLPENLSETVNSISEKENTTKSECAECDKRESCNIIEELARGYQEMGDLNLSISEEFFTAEHELLVD